MSDEGSAIAREVAFGDEMLQLLVDRGVVSDLTQRVVIDIQQGAFVMMYLQQAIDTDALRVVLGSPGIDVSVKVTSEETTS